MTATNSGTNIGIWTTISKTVRPVLIGAITVWAISGTADKNIPALDPGIVEIVAQCGTRAQSLHTMHAEQMTVAQDRLYTEQSSLF